MKPDQFYIDKVRAGVKEHITLAAARWDMPGMLVLDVAPNEHDGARTAFMSADVETMDISPKYNPTHVRDICEFVPLNSEFAVKYDCIICTEVLEHTAHPFAAAANLMAMLKPGGELYLTTPFNLRIHNPLPDNWRFTEHGLRILFKGYKIQITQTETPERQLMPIQYKTIVWRNK